MHADSLFCYHLIVFKASHLSFAWGPQFIRLKAQSSENTDISFSFSFEQLITLTSFLHIHTPCIHHPAWICTAITFWQPTHQFFILFSAEGMSWAVQVPVTFPVDKSINNHLKTEKSTKCSSSPLSARSVMARAQLGFDRICFLLGCVHWH